MKKTMKEIMKKGLLVILLVMVSGFLYSQVTFKGIKIGEEYYGKDFSITSVVDIDFGMKVYSFDNKVSMILLIPTIDGKHTSRLYGSQIDKIIEGFEKSYDTEFTSFGITGFIAELTGSDDYEEKVYVVIKVDPIEGKSPPNDVHIQIKNMWLDDLRLDKEIEKRKNNHDF